MGSVRTNLLLVFHSTKSLCKHRKEFYENSCHYSGLGSSVDIATGYELDGPGIEYRWRRNFPHLSRPALGTAQPPVQWVQVLPGGKERPGPEADPLTPF